MSQHGEPTLENMYDQFNTAVVIEIEPGEVWNCYRLLNSNGDMQWYSEDYIKTFCTTLTIEGDR
jgi:hypothetical protein